MTVSAAAVWLAMAASPEVSAQQSADEVAELREMIDELKSDYQTRIRELEERLEEAEQAVAEARERADEAGNRAEEVARRPVQRTSTPSDQNPAVSAVLVGSYKSLDVGGEDYAIPGFILGPETGPGEPGFSLGESEINMNASIDDKFYGNLTFALADHEGKTEVELEEAYLETLALPAGFRLRGGRFFSNIGYLNEFHVHADDFVDRPLAYQAFLARQYKDDGLQLTWLAPTDTFLQLGAEVFRGGAFPAGAEADEKPGAWSLFAEAGGDVGISHSWKAGLSYLNADVDGRAAGGGHEDEHVFFKQEEDEHEEEGLFFAGDSDLWVADFVYKWSPDGNPRNRNFKLQGEYFRRDEKGSFGDHPYDGEQTGWYLQGSYQFHPQWRAGYRYDRLDADNDGEAVVDSPLDPMGLNPDRHSVVLEWFNSEFSRVRFQYSRDESTAVSDNQFLLQYILSLGAHGAHQF